jgi:putative membrane protein
MKIVLGMALLAATPAALMAQMAAPPTKDFVKKAGASDLFERQEGRLMMTSTNPAVKKFAAEMVRDHTKSTNDIKAAARASRVVVPAPKLDAEQMRNLAALRAASGAARDQLYIDQQKAAHQSALALMEAYGRDGGAKPLRMAASKIAPVVKMHLDMLSKM